jgi:DNA-binding transcriptional regulator YhcF (GntR family)
MRRAEVHIPRPLLALFGITPSAASRAYHALGEAGEVEVTREPGCAVRLRLKMLADEGI